MEDTNRSKSGSPTTISFFSSKPEDEYGYLSNFHQLALPLEYEGQRYPTSEHLYQARKYLYEGACGDSMLYAEKIRNANTPYKSKLLGNMQEMMSSNKPAWRWELDETILTFKKKGVQMREDWDSVKDDIMLSILRQKFKGDEKLKKQLLSTKNSILQEDSPYDSYWGIGSDGKGQNRLGILLMKVREELKEKKSLSSSVNKRKIVGGMGVDSNLVEKESKKKKIEDWSTSTITTLSMYDMIKNPFCTCDPKKRQMRYMYNPEKKKSDYKCEKCGKRVK